MLTRDDRLELGFLISDTARLLRRVVDQRAGAHGLTRAQWVILKTLSREQGVRQVDLAGELELEPITVARLVDKLEAAGLVERRRDPADRRAHRLYLRPDATPVLERLREEGDALMQALLAGSSDADALQLRQTLGRIRSNLLGCTRQANELEPADVTA